MPAQAGMTQPTREPQRLAVYLCNGHLEVRTIQTVQAHNHQGRRAARLGHQMASTLRPRERP